MSEQGKSLPQRIREADLEELNDGELLEEAAYSLELADARIAALEAALQAILDLLKLKLPGDACFFKTLKIVRAALKGGT